MTEHTYAVLYNDRHVDFQLEPCNTLNQAVALAEGWIMTLGYQPREWECLTDDEKDLTAVMAYHHPCEEDSVSIFKF